MQRRILIALLLALPIEAVNFFVVTPPLDVDTGPADHWYQNVILAQWLVLHLPAMRFSWLLESMGLRLNLLVALFVGGYLATALLIFLVLWGIHRLRRGTWFPAPQRG